MRFQGLYILATASLFSCTSGNKNSNTYTASLRWRFPVLREGPATRIERQIPPHPEPDAVLIDIDGNGQPVLPGAPPRSAVPRTFGTPEVPTDPGIYGHPRSVVFGIPQGPGVFGIPQGPGVFGIPQGSDVSGIPQGPGVLRIPIFPNTGLPAFHIVSGNPMKHDVYGVSRIPNGPGTVVTQAQFGPLMPTGPNILAARVGQNKPGVFGAYDDALQPEFVGQRRLFVMSGSSNVPFPNAPWRFPETFLPRSGRRIFPSVFYPKTPATPNALGGSSGGSSLNRKGAGGHELNDNSKVDSFPLVDTPPTFFEIPSL